MHSHDNHMHARSHTRTHTDTHTHTNTHTHRHTHTYDIQQTYINTHRACSTV